MEEEEEEDHLVVEMQEEEVDPLEVVDLEEEVDEMAEGEGKQKLFDIYLAYL